MIPTQNTQKARIPMPTNHYSLQRQIVNFLSDVDFKNFLNENPAAKIYYEDLEPEQQKQYLEDFWYFVHLATSSMSFLEYTQFPIHEKL